MSLDEIRQLREKRDAAYLRADYGLLELIQKARKEETMEAIGEAMGMSRQGVYHFCERVAHRAAKLPNRWTSTR